MFSLPPRTGVQNKADDDKDFLDCTKMLHAVQVTEQMRRQRLFCDVILSAGNIEVHAHKVVLAANSQYFYAKLTKELQGKHHIVLPSSINSEALTTLVDYMYGVKIQITERNAEVRTVIIDYTKNVILKTCLLPAAHTLMLNAVKDTCCRILKDELVPTNCINIKTIAENCECFELVKNVQCYINRHFSEVAVTEQFRTMQFKKLSQLISRDTLAACAEEKLYEAVMSWLKYDIKARKKYLGALMQQVHLQLLPIAYLVANVTDEPLLKGNIKYRDNIIEAFKHHFNIKVVLAVLGGSCEEMSKTMEYFDFEKGRWSEIIKIPHSVYGSAVTVDNKIFVVGKDQMTDTIYEYDVSSDQWITANSRFPCKPRFTSSDTANNCILVADSTIERIAKFNSKTLNWSSFPPLSHGRLSSRIAVVANKIFVIDALNSIKVYGEDLKRWTSLPLQISTRYNMGVGVIDRTVYLIGGLCDLPVRILNSVEAFDTEENILIQIAPLNIPRYNPGVVTVNNLLYVVGGYDGTHSLSSVEVYDAKTNIWTLLPATMNNVRCSPAVTLVNKSKLKQEFVI